MLYHELLKLKEYTQSITDFEVVHLYLHALEGASVLHAQGIQEVLIEFEDSYTLLYAIISDRLELAHAYYDASLMRQSSLDNTLQPTQLLGLCSPQRSIWQIRLCFLATNVRH